MTVVVVIPTYNEAKNIIDVLERTLKYNDVSVLVVDDNSPDGTADLVREYMKSHSEVSLITGEKQGLGAAYIRGFNHAISSMGADVLVEMDADHSHDPRDIPRLLEALDEADFVIGSRYVQGGSISGWNPWRHFLSRSGNLVARIVSGLIEVRDCTAGFRALKKEVVSNINWQSFSGGYSFQVRLLFHAKQEGFVIKEVPVHFSDREHGDSKLGFSDMIGFLHTAIELGVTRSSRLMKFLLVGVLGMGVNVLMFWLLASVFSSPEWVAIAVGVEMSILSNFLFHDNWTFIDRNSNPVGQRLARYHLSSLGGVIITYASYYAIMFAGVFSMTISYAIAVGVASIWNFLVSYFWAWKK